MRFNHIGIFTKSLDYGRKHMHEILDIKRTSREFHDKALKVSVQFMTDKSNIAYEIVAPYGKNNPVDKVLNEKKNILNHIAYSTDQFDKEIKKLRDNGCAPLGTAQKALAFNYAKIIFFVTPLNFVIEIVQEIKKNNIDISKK